MKQNFFVLCLVTMLFSSTGFSKTSLAIGPGTMHLGGTVQMPIKAPKHGATYIGFKFTPSFDYFLTKGFAFGISPTVQKESVTNQKAPWSFGVDVRGTYHFTLGGTVYPYLGASAGVIHQTKSDRTLFQATIPLGILVALNNRVALDFGLPLQFSFSSNGYEMFEMPIGYAGVRGFF